MKEENNPNIAIYQGKNGEIQINFNQKEETFWLTQKQISEIFDIDRTVITKHINNIFKDGELNEKSNVQKMHITNSDKPVKYYNLDIVLSVGYKTNSKKAIEFRKWATSVLKEHITKGFTINKNVIKRNYNEFLKAVEDLKSLTTGKDISNDEVLNLVTSFANTWFSLESFDKGNLPSSGFTQKTLVLEVKNLYKDIEFLKKDLMQKKLATDMFAEEKNKGNLEGIFGNIFASFDGVDLYETIEEKGANLLYFVIKNHPFNDGNKRTGAFCFVWFLQKYSFDFSKKISPETLTTLTLLIAQSDPKEKNKMIGLILLLLK